MAKKMHFETPGSVEIELAEGLVYNRLPLTRKIQLQMATVPAKLQKVAELEDDDADGFDTLVESICTIYDLILKPCGANRKKASTYVIDLWKRDGVTLEAIVENLRELGEVRPT